MTEKIFPAVVESFPLASDFIEGELQTAGVPKQTVLQVLTAFEELFVNVALYAYPKGEGDVMADIAATDGRIVCVLKDSGIPFNPLEKEDPDITLPLAKRGVGGLGIFMVKKLTDEVAYEYKDGMNVVTFVKKY